MLLMLTWATWSSDHIATGKYHGVVMHAQMIIRITGQHKSRPEAMAVAALNAVATRCASTTACAPLRHGLQLNETTRQMLPWALLTP